ncbi:MAG: hypothetical protein AB7E72_01550 [Lysobacterales bacterium]
MKNAICKILKVVLAASCFTGADRAAADAVPPLMNYQGILTDASGQPLSAGRYLLTFNVYDVPSGGTAVWGPQEIAVDVVDGYFNVVLSVDSTGGDSISSAFLAEPRYIGIRVDSGGEILPRQQVLSAPYVIQAERAAHADTAESVVGTSNIFPSDGNVGIGTLEPERKLDVIGDSHFSGNVEVAGEMTTTGDANFGGLIVASTLQLDSQKWCRSQSSSGDFWAATYSVPSSWTIANCREFSQTVIGGTAYLVGCIFGNGTGSAGPVNGGAPNPNCGW